MSKDNLKRIEIERLVDELSDISGDDENEDENVDKNDQENEDSEQNVMPQMSQDQSLEVPDQNASTKPSHETSKAEVEKEKMNENSVTGRSRRAKKIPAKYKDFDL